MSASERSQAQVLANAQALFSTGDYTAAHLNFASGLRRRTHDLLTRKELAA